MDSQATDVEIKRAKHLHSVLLFDFIVIHIFMFVLAISMIKTSLIPLILMPALSSALLGYVMLKAKQALASESSKFVLGHMLLAAKRARLFLGLFLITGSFTAVMYFGGPQFGMNKITSYSLAFGIGQLPFMVALLVLVVLEFDAEHQCKSSKIPTAALVLLPADKQA